MIILQQIKDFTNMFILEENSFNRTLKKYILSMKIENNKNFTNSYRKYVFQTLKLLIKKLHSYIFIFVITFNKLKYFYIKNIININKTFQFHKNCGFKFKEVLK